MDENIAFWMIWGSLIFALPTAVIVRRYWSDALKPITIALGTLFVASSCLAILKVSFSDIMPNIVGFSLSYFALCFLAVSCWDIRNKAVKFPAIFITILPIGLGYVAATIGVLGLLFVVGDIAQSPRETQYLQGGFTCKVTTWGMAASDSGYTVHLYKTWPALPMLEKKVAKIIVNETSSSIGPRNASCTDALALAIKPSIHK